MAKGVFMSEELKDEIESLSSSINQLADKIYGLLHNPDSGIKPLVNTIDSLNNRIDDLKLTRKRE